MNGYFINGHYAPFRTKNTNIFSVDSGCTLNLYDCNKTKQKHYFVESDANKPEDNYWIPSINNEVTPISLDGGYLYCNNCLAVGTNGTFNMYGGSIVGNSMDNPDPSKSFGEHNTIISNTLNNAGTIVNIEGGNIVGCNASSIISITGGKDGSSINISGGEIRNCFGSSCIIYSASKLNMTGGKIHNCYAAEDPGIIFNQKNISEAKFAGNAEITDNVSVMAGNGDGGCVINSGSEIKLGGTAKIVRNRVCEDHDSSHPFSQKLKGNKILSNVTCLGEGSVPMLTPIVDGEDSLRDGARFGFTGKISGVRQDECTFTNSLTKSCKKYFFSDNPNSSVRESEDDHALRIVKITNPVAPGESIKLKPSEMPKDKPTIDNVELTKGILDKDQDIAVVIKDKEDLGEIKEKVDENIKKQLTSNSNLISQFDISLEQDGVEIENIDGNEYKVTLRLPANYAGLSKQNVIYINTDGTVEMKETTVSGNKCSFVTSHFSTWGFAAEGKLGIPLSAGAIAGIAVGSTAGGGTIFFVVFIVFFKKKLRFVKNGNIIYEVELKRNERIDLNNKNIAGDKWFTDKQLTKPFKKTKMGFFSKTVYCDKVRNTTNIYLVYGHTLEQYNKKYKNKKYHLLKYTRKQIDEFDKRYSYYQFNNKTYALKYPKDYLLRGRTWWVIEDTYYEIPKL